MVVLWPVARGGTGSTARLKCIRCPGDKGHEAMIRQMTWRSYVLWSVDVLFAYRCCYFHPLHGMRESPAAMAAHHAPPSANRVWTYMVVRVVELSASNRRHAK